MKIKKLMRMAAELGGAMMDFLLDHRWAQLMVTVLASIAGSLIAILLLTYLGLAGYIPLPWWL